MDDAFGADKKGLQSALDWLVRCHGKPLSAEANLPGTLPATGVGEAAALDALAPLVIGGARNFASVTSLMHMDPPAPWIAWAATLWNASLNQNLLHRDTAPVAREIETRVIAWLAPFFGMAGGHMTPGSTLANLTALWAAREVKRVTHVVASEASHISIAKAAHLLGLKYVPVPADAEGMLDAAKLPGDLDRAALVLTAGTTIAGDVDPLALAGRAAWTHVDAAWAGPLRLSDLYSERLNGIERADSVSVSAHKLFFQPKDSALVFFRDADKAHAALSFGAAYLAHPNVGLQGSHSAVAVPLLATLWAWGREGLVRRVERCMAIAEDLADRIAAESRLMLLRQPRTGVVVWRPAGALSPEALHARLPPGSTSLVTIEGQRWLRNVAANPNADVDALFAAIADGLAAAAA